MNIEKEINEITGFKNLELLATQVVEGFISGLHKSPFHGFSAEFAEHKIYNSGESTKHIDWKLYAKTDKLYTKRYEEETNLRCHLIIDNSSSMHYPRLKEFSINSLSLLGLAPASFHASIEPKIHAPGSVRSSSTTCEALAAAPALANPSPNSSTMWFRAPRCSSTTASSSSWCKKSRETRSAARSREAGYSATTKA